MQHLRHPTPIHVFFPITPEKSRGDALLQLAGFFVAEDMWKDSNQRKGSYNVNYHGHQNRFSSVQECIENLMECHLRTNQPLILIFTMRHMARSVHEYFETREKKRGDWEHIQKFLTVIFIVASIDTQRFYGENFFYSLVSGKARARHIVNKIKYYIGMANKIHEESSAKQVVNVYASSEYGAYISSKISGIMQNCQEGRNLELKVTNDAALKDMIKEIPAEYGKLTILVIISYDRHLVIAFNLLSSESIEKYQKNRPLN